MIKKTNFFTRLSAFALIVPFLIFKPVFAQFDNFITVEGALLMDGEKEFRSLSFNVPTLNYVEDNMNFDETNPYGLPGEFELRDVFESLKDLGANAVRLYTIPVRNKNFPEESVTYVEGPGEFNEEAFKVLDQVLALASEYKIRLIIPFINDQQWMGGRPNYADFRGKDSNDFWTDPQLIDDFKQTIKFVVNRTNTITGIKYKDDKSILAWETGNELKNTPEWAINISRYIKTLDSNHLLMDGYFAIHGVDLHDFVKEYSIEEPSIDIISTHHYEASSQEMIDDLKKTVDIVGGKKPIIVDEFGFIGTSGVERVIDYIIKEKRIAGALLWSLRRHHPRGGFYHHSEPFSQGLYRAYHWPGFDDGKIYDERNTLKIYREKAFEIRGLPVPPISAPSKPQILPFSKTPKFTWLGSSGAEGYDIERSESPNGPWKLIAHDIEDIDTPGFDLYSDESAEIGKSYYYRLIALNSAGKSEPSEVYGPVKIEYLTRVDYAEHMMTMDSYKNMRIKSGEYRSFKEAFTRLHGSKDAQGVYTVPGTLKELRIYNYESSKKPDLIIEVSNDGKKYVKVKAKVQRFVSKEKNYDYLKPTLYTVDQSNSTSFKKKIEYVRFKATTSDVNIVRVELDYSK